MWSRRTRSRRARCALGWSPIPTPRLPRASMSAKSSWPTPAARCMMGTRSRPYSPMNSTDRYADDNHYLGMVEPLALQLQFLDGSESMGDHDSGFDDWWSVGRRYADAVGFSVERGQATDSSAVYAGSGRDLGWTVSRWTVEQRGA